jgi:Family of unknown function (DUF6288)/HEAT repeats
MIHLRLIAVLVITLALSFLLAARSTAAEEKNAIPDFTQGGKKPDTHDWLLGPTGARGWIYATKGKSLDARQILITAVTKGSPADGILNDGDVIVGVGDKPFSDDARITFARAITTAEQKQSGGVLRLVRWRAGKTENVSITIPVMGTYSDTAPYDCPKSKLIFENGCQVIAKKGLGNFSIPSSLNALALLASGKKEYEPLLAEYAKKVSSYTADSFATWYYGYANIFLAEYVLATGDKSVLPGVKRIAMECVIGQSGVGTWGHKFARPDGNLSGYGSMNLPALPLTISMVLARQAGINDPDLDRGIAKSVGFLRWYVGKGAIPYGDHEPWMGHEDNGKCSIGTILYDLLGDSEATTFFAKMSMAGYDERERGHTGNFFNVLWALPGVSRCGPLATGAYWKEQSWYYDLARAPDGSFGYQGSPDGEEEHKKYTGWDCTGAHMLTYALPLKSLYLTGKRSSAMTAVNAKEAEGLILDGRGYRNNFYEKLSSDDIMRRLGSWSPIVRERAATEIARRKEAPIDALVKMLESPTLEFRYGACVTMAKLKEAAVPAVPALLTTLQHKDLWLRIEAARALNQIGAVSAVPELLKILAREPAKDDPRGMEQRYLLLDRILKKPIAGVDLQMLYAAIRAGLHNQDGRARSEIAPVYAYLKPQQIEPLLPDIYQAIIKLAPSGEMFADGIRLAGLDLLSRLHIREGMILCVSVIELDRWGQGKRLPKCLEYLARYGVHAKEVLPQLREMRAQLAKSGKAKAPSDEVKLLDSTIAAIEASTASPKVVGLKDFTAHL